MKKIGFLFALLLLLTACGKESAHEKLRVAATSVPHAEILEQIVPEMKNKGFDLEIVVMDDYHIPNRALADGEVDANFFQHLPFLKRQIEEFNYDIEPFVQVHIEPMGVYSQKMGSLDELQEGAMIAIPSDPSNQARALQLLAREGLIGLKDKQEPGLSDIMDNSKKISFVDIDSSLLARALDDVDAGVITANFALQAGLSPLEDALAIEDSRSEYVNVVAIRRGTGEQPKFQALKEVLAADALRDFISTRYHGSIINR